MQLENCEMILFLLQSTRLSLKYLHAIQTILRGSKVTWQKRYEKRKPFGGKSKIVIILYYWKRFVKTGNSLRYGFVLQKKKYLADIANEVHHNSKRFGLSSSSKIKENRSLIKYSMVRTSFPTTLHTPTPFLSTVSPSTKITLVVAILRRSVFLCIH